MLKIMQENLEDLTSANLWRSVAAELLGTLFLVLIGCGTTTNQQLQTLNVSGTNATAGAMPANIVQISLAFGLVVATMVWCIAHISGGHINPAVTLGALVTRRISIVRALMYIVAQLAGAMVGAGILFGLTPSDAQGGLGVNGLSNITDAQGFGVEVMTTFILVFTVLASIDEDRKDLHGSAPLTIGIAVVIGHLFSIQYTGCGMNPARSFGPAVVMGAWANHWVYWIGPLVGGFVAAILYEYIFSAGATFTRTKTFLMRSKNKTPSKEVANNTDDKVEVIQIEEKKSKDEEDQTLERGMKLEKLPLIDGEGAADSTQKDAPTSEQPQTETTST